MSSQQQPAGRHALVVDDNAHCAALAGAVLSASGWTFDCARDGFEAIVRVRNRAYDAVLLDYRLPGMDGVQVLNWIRRNIENAPEIVVLSSEDPDLLHRAFGALGVRAILPKPPVPADLWQALSPS